MPVLNDAFRQHIDPLRAPRTVATYLGVAHAFEVHVGHRFHAPGRDDVESFLARPRPSGARPAPATRNQELAALRVLARFACSRGFWPADPTLGIPFLREPPRDPAVLSVSELHRFFRAAATEPNPAVRARNLAILALLSQAGLRVHELVALDADQVDRVSATLVAVGGKGSTVHDIPLSLPTLVLLFSWLSARGSLSGAEERPALFLSLSGGRMTVRSIQRLIADLRSKTGTKKCVTPHTLRHTAATLALTLGTDLSTVGDLLRHSDLNTTRRYLHLVDSRRRDAVRRLSASIPPELATPQPRPNVVPSEEIGQCAQRSSQNEADCNPHVDAQCDLGDVHAAA